MRGRTTISHRLQNRSPIVCQNELHAQTLDQKCGELPISVSRYGLDKVT
jgi:hypothetical protein